MSQEASTKAPYRGPLVQAGKLVHGQPHGRLSMGRGSQSEGLYLRSCLQPLLIAPGHSASDGVSSAVGSAPCSSGRPSGPRQLVHHFTILLSMLFAICCFLESVPPCVEAALAPASVLLVAVGLNAFCSRKAENVKARARGSPWSGV